MYTNYHLLTEKEAFCTIGNVMKTVSAKYARQNFAEIINEVHFGKKKIMITKSGKPMVILTSTKEQQKKKR